MARKRVTNDDESKTRRPPARTPLAREQQLIALAVDLAEKQLANGTASAPVVAHFLKLGSSREHLEQERIDHENRLLKARTDALESAARIEELYSEALDAMRSYAGQAPQRRVREEDDEEL